MQKVRSLSGLYDLKGNVLKPAGSIATLVRVIPQEGMDYPDLEVVYPDGFVEISPADTFEPVEDGRLR